MSNSSQIKAGKEQWTASSVILGQGAQRRRPGDPASLRNYFRALDSRLRGNDGNTSLQTITSRSVIGLLALLFAACSGPTPPIEPEPEKTKVSLSISADLTEVNVDVESPITLSTLQAVITFDPAQIQLGNATQGADGPRISKVFDDGARVPGKLLVGLADVNQNPLPRSGSVVRVALTNSSAGDVLGLESVVAVDIFGNKVPAEDIEVTGVTVE